MAISTPVIETEGTSSADATSYTTASFTPPSNRLLICGVWTGHTTPPAPTPVVTGCGLTWTQRGQVFLQTSTVAITVFTAWGSPTTGALTIDTSASGTSLNAHWRVLSLEGADLAAPLQVGSAQSGGATNTLTGTLPSGLASGSATVMLESVNSSSQTISSYSNGYTGLGTWTQQSSPSSSAGVAYHLTPTTSYGFVSSGTSYKAALVLELAEAAAPAAWTRSIAARFGV